MNTKLATAQIRVKNWTAIEYSCAMKSHFRKFGNQMSGSGITCIIMRVYSRNALSKPYTSLIDLSCSASILVMLMR